MLLPFEVTWDAQGLDAAMTVYEVDDLGGASIVVGPTAMFNVPNTNTYLGWYRPQPGNCYLVLKAVYADSTFQEFDGDHSQSSETFFAQGQVMPTFDEIGGTVVDEEEVIGEAVDDESEINGYATDSDQTMGSTTEEESEVSGTASGTDDLTGQTD